MSDGLNQVFLMGNLGADPELRCTQAGQSVLNLRMATTESYLDRDKNRQERTEWHSVVVWGNRAEGLAKILAKGSKIVVVGSLRTSDYEKNGEKRFKTEIHAKEVLLAGGSAPRAGSGRGASRGDTYESQSGGHAASEEELPY